MPDRGTKLINERKGRKQKVLKRITENPGIELTRLAGGISWEEGVSMDKVEVYIHELDYAGLIVPDMGKLWTAEAYEQMKTTEAEKKFLAEDIAVASAKKSGMEPLENFTREDSKS